MLNVTNGAFTESSILNQTLKDEEASLHADGNSFLNIFLIVVRGVMFSVVQFITTVLNISSVIVIYKHRNLQTPSNALVSAFSIGHVLAGISIPLNILTTFIIEKHEKTWEIVCLIQIFFGLIRQKINIFCIMAISIERAYSIYFPLHAHSTNTFRKMMKISTLLIIFVLLLVTAEVALGFVFGNFQHRALCTPTTITGMFVVKYIVLTTIITSSVIGLFMTVLIVLKLIWLQRRQNADHSFKNNNSEYRITKMLLTGKTMFNHFTINNSVKMTIGLFTITKSIRSVRFEKYN